MTRIIIYIAAVSVFLSSQTISFSADIKEFFLTCDPDDFAMIYENFKEDIYIPATIAYDGQTWPDVEMRIRGDGTRYVAKKSLKIRFNSQPFANGRKRLNLNAEWDNKSYIAQYISSRLMQESGHVCFDSEHVRLYLNGEFFGLYLMVENIDNDFLAANGLDKDGNLYKATKDGASLSPNEDIARLWDKKTNKTTGMDDLAELIRNINSVSDEDYYEFAKATFEFDKMINIIAMNMLLSNGSTYYHNYYMYHDIKGSGKWSMIPWDLDKTLSRYSIYLHYAFSSNVWTHDNPFVERALICEPIFNKIRERVSELSNTIFNKEHLYPIIDSLKTVLESSVRADTTDDVDNIEEWYDMVEKERKFIDGRYYELNNLLDKAPKNFRAVPTEDIFTDDIIFTWHPSIDPHGKAMTYDFLYCPYPSFSKESTVKFEGLADTTFTLIPKPEYGKYYWKIMAFNGIYRTDSYDNLNRFTYKKATVLPCEIEGDMVLTSEDSPYIAQCGLVVPKGSSLTIQEGVEIRLRDTCSIWVSGQINSLGSPAKPVIITKAQSVESIDSLNLMEPDAICRLSHTKFDNILFRFYGADVTMSNIEYINSSDLGLWPVANIFGGTQTIDRCTFTSNNTGEGLIFKMSVTEVKNSSLINMPDAIEFLDMKNSSIENNIIVNAGDDAIDLNGCTNISIRKNIIFGAKDKGLSIGSKWGMKPPSTDIRVENNLIVNCQTGISVKSGSRADIVNNTLYNNDISFRLYEKFDGLGGGKANVVNTILANSKTANFDLDDKSEIVFSYSLCDSEQLAGTGNIRAEPLFVNPAEKDFNILSTSPCIDAGNPASPNDPDGSRADIGAYSFFFVPAAVVINEINYNSAAGFDTGDWVELYNATGSEVDLTSWIFKDSDDTHEFIFPDGTKLQPGGYLILCRDSARFAEFRPGIGDYIGDFNFGLSSSGELARLFDAGGKIIDSLTYGIDIPWPSGPNGSGQTLELVFPFRDNAKPVNWYASIEEYGTPGRINSTYTDSVNDSNAAQFNMPIYAFPNPANQTMQVIINPPQGGIYTLQLISSNGIVIKDLLSRYFESRRKQLAININGIAGGFYFLRLISNNNAYVIPFIIAK